MFRLPKNKCMHTWCLSDRESAVPSPNACPPATALLQQHRLCFSVSYPQVKGLLDKGGVLMAKTGGYLANVRALKMRPQICVIASTVTQRVHALPGDMGEARC